MLHVEGSKDADQPLRYGIHSGFTSKHQIKLIEEEISNILLLRQSHDANNTSSVERDVTSYGEKWVFQENLWKESEMLRRWLLEGEPAKLVANLIGSDRAWLLRDQTYFKSPGGEHTPWHQDALFVPIDHCNILTLWIPLTEIRNDHDSPLLYWEDGADACHLLDQTHHLDKHNQQMRNWLGEGWEIISTSGLSVGDCTHHNGWTLHGSAPHTGQQPRKAYVVVFGIGEGVISSKPPMGICPTGLRDQARMLRRGLRQVCFEGLPDGTPVPTHHNPWIFVQPGE